MTGAEIRSVREALKLSQSQFAMLLGVHAVTVSRWETGAQSPTPYQTGLIQEFSKAAKRKQAVNNIATVLVTAGAIAGLFFLLKWALEKEEQNEDLSSMPEEEPGHPRRVRHS
jgi:transcriptional regulator with XRE-family HTH domain